MRRLNFFLLLSFLPFYWLSEFSLHPHSVHGLLVFPVLDNSVVIHVLDAFKVRSLVSTSAEKCLHLLEREVIRSCLICSYVKVVLELGIGLLRESQLCKVVSAIVAEVEDSARPELSVDLLCHSHEVLRGYCRQDED